MSHSTLAFDELVFQMASRTVSGGEGTRSEVLIDPESGQQEGVLMETLLERVAVFARSHDSLSLAEVSQVRRTMARAHARRAYVYVPLNTIIQKPVMLLATLSKIRIVPVDVAHLPH